jgi:hypothetical protein
MKEFIVFRKNINEKLTKLSDEDRIKIFTSRYFGTNLRTATVMNIHLPPGIIFNIQDIKSYNNPDPNIANLLKNFIKYYDKELNKPHKSFITEVNLCLTFFSNIINNNSIIRDKMKQYFEETYKPKEIEPVINTILDQNFDFIGLQELSDTQIDEIQIIIDKHTDYTFINFKDHIKQNNYILLENETQIKLHTETNYQSAFIDNEVKKIKNKIEQIEKSIITYYNNKNLDMFITSIDSNNNKELYIKIIEQYTSCKNILNNYYNDFLNLLVTLINKLIDINYNKNDKCNFDEKTKEKIIEEETQKLSTDYLRKEYIIDKNNIQLIFNNNSTVTPQVDNTKVDTKEIKTLGGIIIRNSFIK